MIVVTVMICSEDRVRTKVISHSTTTITIIMGGAVIAVQHRAVSIAAHTTPPTRELAREGIHQIEYLCAVGACRELQRNDSEVDTILYSLEEGA